MANVTVTYEFRAGEKAQASQVNKNFQDCINGINQNASDIAQNASDISSLQTSKAGKNGSGSEVFSVADPTTSNQAVNKGYLENAITPILDYINGLIITKSSNTEIAISAGSCYDSTQKEILALSSSYTASYSGTLEDGEVYWVFIRKSKSTSTVDCVILDKNSNPDGNDYYYRKIGEVVTDSDAYISTITNYCNSSIEQVVHTGEKQGYLILASGIIIQWWYTSETTRGTFNFPIAFPNKALSIACAGNEGSISASAHMNCGIVSNSQFQYAGGMYSSGALNIVKAYIIAIGY